MRIPFIILLLIIIAKREPHTLFSSPFLPVTCEQVDLTFKTIQPNFSQPNSIYEILTFEGGLNVLYINIEF